MMLNVKTVVLDSSSFRAMLWAASLFDFVLLHARVRSMVLAQDLVVVPRGTALTQASSKVG